MQRDKKEHRGKKSGGAAQHRLDVPSPPLEVLRTKLEKALSSLVQP